MESYRDKLLAIISCSKCGCIVQNERTYINNEKFCTKCAATFDAKCARNVLVSSVWKTLCQMTLTLFPEYNDKQDLIKEVHSLPDTKNAEEIKTSNASSVASGFPIENSNEKLQEINLTASNSSEKCNRTNNANATHKSNEVLENGSKRDTNSSSPPCINIDAEEIETNDASPGTSEFPINKPNEKLQEINLTAYNSSGNCIRAKKANDNHESNEVLENSYKHDQNSSSLRGINIDAEEIKTNDASPGISEFPLNNPNKKLQEINFTATNSSGNCIGAQKANVTQESNEVLENGSSPRGINIDNNLRNCKVKLEIASDSEVKLKEPKSSNKSQFEETLNNQLIFLAKSDAVSSDEVDEAISSDNNKSVIEKSLIHFFKNGKGSSLIKKYIDCDISPTSINDNEIKCYESVIQKEMEYFFYSENGKMLLRSVIADEVGRLIDRQVKEDASDVDATVNDANASNYEYESDNDMFVPPTPPNCNTAAISKIMATSISIETREIINKFAQYFNLKMNNSLYSDTDCLVSDEEICTHKWLYARCKGIPIINSNWMIDSLKCGVMLPITDYLFQPSFSLPSFFKTLDVILCPPFSDLPENDYNKLFSMAGARVNSADNWLPGPKHLKRLIVLDDTVTSLSDVEMQSRIKFYRAPAVSKSYLLSVILTGTVDCIENHMCDAFQLNRNVLKQMGFPCRDDQECS